MVTQGGSETLPPFAFMDLIWVNEQVAEMTITGQKPRNSRWIVLVMLLGVAAVMYVSIMYKIVKFGP